VVGVIEPDANELADAAHARAQAQVLLRHACHQWQRLDVEAAQARQAFGQQRGAADVVNDAREVAHAPRCIEHAGPFLAAQSVA